MARGRSGRTDRARETFLAVLADTCNVSEAARRAGLSRTSAYEWRADDAGFAAAWQDAEDAAGDKLEEVAFARATSGQSDRMLEILLKAHRPKYRDKQAVELTGKDGGAIEIEQKAREDADAVAGAIAGLAERARAPGVAG